MKAPPSALGRFRSRFLAFVLRRLAGLDSAAKVAAFAVRRYRDRTWLVEPDGGRRLSFEAAAAEARRAAVELSERGLAAGDVLAYRGRNSIDYYVHRLACHELGIAFLALPASLAEAAAAKLIMDSGAKACRWEGRLEAIVGNGPKRPGIATLNVSSGTTAPIPKIVALSEANWIESLYGYVRDAGDSPSRETVFLGTLPLAAAGSTTFLPALLGGVTCVVVPEQPAPAVLADCIQRHRVSQVYLTPQRLFEFAEYCEGAGLRLPTLGKIITGTDHAPAARLREAIRAFGPIVHVGYGMVEALPPVTMLSPREYRKLGSVGRPRKGVGAEILPDGRIAIAAKTVGLGYLNDPVESAARFRDGRFVTDDYGRVDGDGYLYVFGRRETLVAETPRRIFSAEIEDALYEVPAVRRCAVVAVNGLAAAFVVLRARADAGELERAAGRLAPCKIILRDEIPVNGLGKLDRRALSAELGGC